MTQETPQNTSIKDAFDALDAEMQKKLTEKLKTEGVSDDNIEKVKTDLSAKYTHNRQMEEVRSALHEEYDKKTHHTKEEIAQYHYIQDLKRIEKIREEFPLLEEKQKRTPIWRIGEIMRIKKQRKEMVNLYTKLTRAVRKYELKKNEADLFNKKH